MEKKVRAKRHVLLIYRRMIPSVRLCGHAQMEALCAEGKIEYRAVQGMRLKPSDLAWADLALLGRLDSWYELQVVRRLHEAGKYLIYIMDDDLLNVPAEVSSAGYYNQKCIQGYIREILSLSDAILSPSPRLLEKYAIDGKTGIRTEEPALFPVPYAPHAEGRPVKIGFAGSVDRMGEVESILREALMRIREEYGDAVTFEFFGGRPAFAEALGASCIPYVEDYGGYREKLNRLEWDIGLAPMPESDFHACKHYNKFTEYAAAAVAGIYSDVPPYDRLASFPGCVVLCGNRVEEWVSSLRLLLKNRELRESIRQKAAECAAGPLNVKVISEELLDRLPEVSAAGGEFGALFPLKVINLFRRFGTSVKGHGIGGFVRMIGARAAGWISGKIHG